MFCLRNASNLQDGPGDVSGFLLTVVLVEAESSGSIEPHVERVKAVVQIRFQEFLPFLQLFLPICRLQP